MDALSDVLRVAHLTGGVFLHAEFFAPWCIAARVAPEHCAPALGPASHLIIYHYVVEGDLHIRVEGEDGEDLVIGAGEVVLLPRNDLHLMGSDLSLPPVAGSDIIHPPKEMAGCSPSIMAAPANARGWSAGSSVAPAPKAIR